MNEATPQSLLLTGDEDERNWACGDLVSLQDVRIRSWKSGTGGGRPLDGAMTSTEPSESSLERIVRRKEKGD